MFCCSGFLSKRRSVGTDVLSNTVLNFFELILILFILCNIICFLLLKPIICTRKVYIRDIQSSVLHVVAVGHHLQGATPKTFII
jgi:hypothetical protein